MDAPRAALVMVLFLLGLESQAVVLTSCWYNCRVAIIEDGEKCETRCRINDAERPGRIQRATKNQSFTATPPEVNSEVRIINDCSFGSNRRYGIKNSEAKIRRTVLYGLHENQTKVRVTWDPPAECVQKRDKCKGYLVRWSLATSNFAGPQVCGTIRNKSINYFMLDESIGFDGTKGFFIQVRAFPYQPISGEQFSYEYLPSSEDRTRPYTNILKTSPITIPTHPLKENGVHNEANLSPITLINLLSAIAVVVIIIVIIIIIIVSVRCCKPKPRPVPITLDDQGIKGKVYVSYLPDKSITNEVTAIYSWLKSHSIEVVMDQTFNDHKLYNSIGPKRFGEKCLALADKVVMIISPGYLKLCFLDDTVNLDSKPRFNSLNEERLYSEASYIKNELSTTLQHDKIRFIPILVNVSHDNLPKWLQKLTSVKWRDDGKNTKFLYLLNDDDQSFDNKRGKFSLV